MIEHGELSDAFLHSIEALRHDLQDKISNQMTLGTLVNKFQECFIATVSRCEETAQNMPYANRSNKRGEQLAALSAAAGVGLEGSPESSLGQIKKVLPRPDSEAFLIDECSDESGSNMGGMQKEEITKTIKGANRNSNLSTTSTIAVETGEISTKMATSSAQVLSGGGLDAFPMHPVTTSTPSTGGIRSAAPMIPTDIHAWSQNVMYHPPNTMAQDSFGIHPANLSLPQDMQWTQSFYHSHPESRELAEDFSGFL